jgi:hypothetical protein
VFLALRQPLAIFAAFLILACTGRADDHLVPLSDLHRDVNSIASERAKNLADVDRVLEAPAVQEQLSKANVRSDRVHAAISQLDDSELARLANRARAADQDIRAGGKGEILFLAGLAVFILLIVVLTQTL